MQKMQIFRYRCTRLYIYNSILCLGDHQQKKLVVVPGIVDMESRPFACDGIPFVRI
jgi:hypothetical protein